MRSQAEPGNENKWIIALAPLDGMRNDSLGRPHTTKRYVSS
jgi:hypothetical protein